MKVIVIGGGAAGLSIGWRLAQRGTETIVIERAQPGCGATWASAGMIAAGRDGGEISQRGAELWPQFAAELEAAGRRRIGFSADGALEIAKTAEELVQLSKAGGEMLSPEQARARDQRIAPDIAGAVWYPRQAKVDNRALGPALAGAFIRAGGALMLNETVVRFELSGDKILGVRTPFALHQGDAYVLAAGAWSPCLEGLPRAALPPVIPVKGEMLALEAPEGEVLPRPAIGGSEIYLVAQRGRLVVGATVERKGFDTSITPRASNWLMQSAAALMPCLDKWKIAEHWAGLRPGSPDDLPILGASVLSGLFIASGQYRNGILYTPAIAQAATAMVLGEDVPFDVSNFDPRRFGTAHA